MARMEFESLKSASDTPLRVFSKMAVSRCSSLAGAVRILPIRARTGRIMNVVIKT
jgi:hypothetical protein